MVNGESFISRWVDSKQVVPLRVANQGSTRGRSAESGDTRRVQETPRAPVDRPPTTRAIEKSAKSTRWSSLFTRYLAFNQQYSDWNDYRGRSSHADFKIGLQNQAQSTTLARNSSKLAKSLIRTSGWAWASACGSAPPVCTATT